MDISAYFHEHAFSYSLLFNIPPIVDFYCVFLSNYLFYGPLLQPIITKLQYMFPDMDISLEGKNSK